MWYSLYLCLYQFDWLWFAFIHSVIATCDQEIKNNITYFISPNFPALMSSNMKSCKLKIKMMSPDISQLRFDFIHFSIVNIYYFDRGYKQSKYIQIILFRVNQTDRPEIVMVIFFHYSAVLPVISNCVAIITVNMVKKYINV